jgi:hypothetical protein
MGRFVNTIYRKSSEPSEAHGALGAAHFVASLDSASLPDMGDRSLDQETHAYIKPRRRSGPHATMVVKRRSGLPFPEPRLPDLRDSPAGNQDKAADIELRQVEENAGLRFIRPSENPPPLISLNRSEAVQSHSIQVAAGAGMPMVSRFACSGPTMIVPPKARDSFVVAAPTFDVEGQATVVRRGACMDTLTAARSGAKSSARFASLEGSIAKMSEHTSARVAVLAIGVTGGILAKVRRLADVVRESYSRKVEVLAAESSNGLLLAPKLSGGRAGEVFLVSCSAGSPHRTLPFLSSFDGVILMVEIGETPVDDAAAWADALRRSEVPLVGVWAA